MVIIQIAAYPIQAGFLQLLKGSKLYAKHNKREQTWSMRLRPHHLLIVASLFRAGKAHTLGKVLKPKQRADCMLKMHWTEGRS
jgi:hypothetical protein